MCGEVRCIYLLIRRRCQSYLTVSSINKPACISQVVMIRRHDNFEFYMSNESIF